MSSVPALVNSSSIASITPRSPTRLVMNALRPASAQVMPVFSSKTRS